MTENTRNRVITIIEWTYAVVLIFFIAVNAVVGNYAVGMAHSVTLVWVALAMNYRLRQGADAIERLEAVVKLLTEHEKFTSCKKCGLHREFGCADPHDCSTQEWNVKFQEMLRIAKGEKK